MADVITPAELSEVEKRSQTPAAAGIAGLLFSTLFITSVVLLYRTPGAGSSAQEIAAWYGGKEARTIGIVGLYLAPFAGIAFLWFIAVIRSRIGDREDRFFATVLFGSGILFVAMMFAAAAAGGSAAHGGQVPGSAGAEPGHHRVHARARVHLPVRLRRSCGSSVHDRRLDDRAAHGDPAAVTRVRRLRLCRRSALQRQLLQGDRAHLPGVGRRGQHRDPLDLPRATARLGS